MADNFDVYEWKFKQLLQEGFEDIPEDSVGRALAKRHISKIRQEFRQLSDNDVQDFVDEIATAFSLKSISENDDPAIGDYEEAHSGVEESMEEGDYRKDLTDQELDEIYDIIKSEQIYDGIITQTIAEYAMEMDEDGRVFYISENDIIEFFEDKGDTLRIDSDTKDDKMEFAAGEGFTGDFEEPNNRVG